MAEDATAHHAQDDDWTQVASSGHEVAQPTPAKPWSNQKEKEESYLVKFEEGDVENPMVRPDPQVTIPTERDVSCRTGVRGIGGS